MDNNVCSETEVDAASMEVNDSANNSSSREDGDVCVHLESEEQPVNSAVKENLTSYFVKQLDLILKDTKMAFNLIKTLATNGTADVQEESADAQEAPTKEISPGIPMISPVSTFCCKVCQESLGDNASFASKHCYKSICVTGAIVDLSCHVPYFMENFLKMPFQCTDKFPLDPTSFLKHVFLVPTLVPMFAKHDIDVRMAGEDVESSVMVLPGEAIPTILKLIQVGKFADKSYLPPLLDSEHHPPLPDSEHCPTLPDSEHCPTLPDSEHCLTLPDSEHRPTLPDSECVVKMEYKFSKCGIYGDGMIAQVAEKNKIYAECTLLDEIPEEHLVTNASLIKTFSCYVEDASTN